MTTAGQLRHRIAFDKRIAVDDGMGNEEGDWQEQFQVSAAVRAKMGGEAVAAARLSGQQPATITVRSSSNTRQVTTDWRARDVHQGTIYNIRSIADPDGLRAWLDMLCQSGVAP